MQIKLKYNRFNKS